MNDAFTVCFLSIVFLVLFWPLARVMSPRRSTTLPRHPPVPPVTAPARKYCMVCQESNSPGVEFDWGICTECRRVILAFKAIMIEDNTALNKES